jgi:NAD(P)H-hydrate epimerase
MPEVAHIPLPETDAPGSARRAVERLTPYLEKAKSVVIGPGLGDDELTEHLLSALFGFGQKISGSGAHIGFGSASVKAAADIAAESPLFRNEQLRVVIDADALNWLSHQDEWWRHVPAGRAVLTPHPGEMARLTGLSAEEIVANLQQVSAEYAAKWGQTVMIKAGFSAASDGQSTVVAEDAPTSLATAGSGDVLAGMVGAFLAQGLDLLDAAGLALYIGPCAARSREKTFGDLGVIATDLPDAIASELGKLT